MDTKKNSSEQGKGDLRARQGQVEFDYIKFYLIFMQNLYQKRFFA